jgi:hypothetical protein
VEPSQRRRLEEVSLLILEVLSDVEPLIKAAFDAVDGSPEPDSALDQAGLIDGREAVQEYLDHGEQGVAFDHLIYMITEPPLVLSSATFEKLVEAGLAMGYAPSTWEPIATTE